MGGLRRNARFFLDSQKVLIPCQVEALLGYFETAVQYNKPNPWQNRCKNKCTVLPIVKNLFHNTRCFTKRKKSFSSSTDILCSQLMDRSSGNELDQLTAINKYNPQPYYLIFFSITIVFQESRRLVRFL